MMTRNGLVGAGGFHWLTSRVEHLLDCVGDAGGIAVHDELETVIGN